MLSNEQKETFTKMWHKGFRAEEIAKALGMTVNEVYVYAKVLGLSSGGKGPANRKIEYEDLGLIKEMWLNGATLDEIADYFGVSRRTIRDYLNAMGLERKKKERPMIGKEELEKLCKRGLTDEEIARICGTSRSHISSLRRGYGINKRLIKLEESKRKIEKIIDALRAKGYVTSKELLNEGIKLNSKLLEKLEEAIEDIRWFKLSHTSTSKYSILPAKFSQLIIVYLKGFEKAVLEFLFNNFVSKQVPLASIKVLLKANGAPQELVKSLNSFWRRALRNVAGSGC